MIASLIQDEIAKAQLLVKQNQHIDISEDRAFSYAIIEHFFYRGDENSINDIHGKVTDGANDGGIDFVHFNEDESTVVVGQSKFTESLSYDDVVDELIKMNSTVSSFRNAQTGSFNSDVQRELQNAIDALPEENQGAIEYYLFTTSTINENEAKKKISQRLETFPLESFTLFQSDDIVSKIMSNMEEIEVVAEDKIRIDKSGNYLSYEEPRTGREGIMVNMSSDSLIGLFNKYKDKGLLALNIRGYVTNKKVDSAIDKTLNKERENFWFYNNGITIACDEFSVSGDMVRLYNFSIVNGGQTTNRVGNYKGSNTETFYIPCKIVAHGSNEDAPLFYSTIAEASNSQKPIKPRDLRANSPEMKRLQRWISDSGYVLEVKRGAKRQKNSEVIKNDDFGQAMLSFIYQQPGTARSSKKSIFENDETYSKLFRKNYEKDPDQKQFIIDLIRLIKRFDVIDKHLKSADSSLNQAEREALKNGRQAIIALMGILYRLINSDVTREELNDDPLEAISGEFEYGAFIRNYSGDDIDELLQELVEILSHQISDAYEMSASANQVTSISNFLKTDNKYRENILKRFIYLLRFDDGKRVLEIAEKLFKR